MDIIDLRSDTVTHPTVAMRKAMSSAEVGDDGRGSGEDPTVNKLQEISAELMGKEAGLFVASGSMGNLVSIMAQTRRGDTIIVGDEAHISYYESLGVTEAGGVGIVTVPNNSDGTMSLDDAELAINGGESRNQETSLICVENSHNRCNGSVLTPTYLSQVKTIALRYGLPVHVDGARIFNAAVSSGLSACELTAEIDSITFCLSKGLGCPVGSVVCGSKEFVQEARRCRSMVGGGMRQAGVLAAAGLVALDTMVDRLEMDHSNARLLAQGLSSMDGIILNPDDVRTNIVIFGLEVGSAPEFIQALASHGVKALATGNSRVRLVTHYEISTQDIEIALGSIRDALKDVRDRAEVNN